MPKVKVKRNKPSLDMTPMVDLAFLLVTFFMLTTQFAPDDAVIVDTPSSVSEIKIPDSNIITIVVDKDDKVYFGVDGQQTRERLLDKIAAKYQVGFTEDEKKTFSLISTFGMPISSLPDYLRLESSDRKKINQPGIPVDSLNNQLFDWVQQTRFTNPKVRIAIKGDGEVSYPTIQKVISTLQKQNINTFNLITDMEARPTSL